MKKQIKNRINNVTNNLRPLTGFKGKFNPPKALKERLEFYQTPGVSIAVIDDFEIDWAQGFGLRDSRFDKKVTKKTLFQAGSISKPISALGVMRLVHEGRLNLDEDIHRYLSSWRVPANDGWQPKITLRQLLSHSAGLTVHGFSGYQASEKLPTVPQILNGEPPANSAKVEVNILPGIQFRYSGGGTTIAQQLLVDLLQKPFPQIIHELIFEPLALTNSTFAQPLPKRWAKRAATAHPWKGIPLKGKYHTYPEMAAAGLWTTPTDLAKVGVEILKVLNDKKEPAVLTKEIIDSMVHPQLPHQKEGDSYYVGLGFFCTGKEDSFYFGHSGGDEGFIAHLRLYKNIGKGAVVMINSNEGQPLIEELMRAIGEEYNWPNILPDENTAINLENSHAYPGQYVSKTGIKFRVNMENGNLMFQFGNQPSIPIFPSSETEFFTKVINASISFEKNDDGEIESLNLNQEGNQIKAEKQSSE